MTESLPWASGKRKPPPGGVKKRRRRFRLKSKRQGVIAAAWAIITLLFLISALLTQAMLYVVLVVLSTLVTALATFAAVGEPDPVPAARAAPTRSANPRGSAESGRTRRQPGTDTIICTQTNVPIDDCPGDHNHVRSARGKARYKKPLGTPYGKSKPAAKAKGPKPKLTKEPRIPTTNNAKPRTAPAGEVMRRVS